MTSNHHGRFFHHFIPKTMPCIILNPSMASSLVPLNPASPSSSSSTMNDHILNLTASLSKHCPLPGNNTKIMEGKGTSAKSQITNEDSVKCVNDSVLTPHVSSVSPEMGEYMDKVEKQSVPGSENLTREVDMNCNNLKGKENNIIEESFIDTDDDQNVTTNDCKSSVSSLSNIDRYASEQMTDVEVDDTSSCDDGEDPFQTMQSSGSTAASRNLSNKSATLTFGIDRILSSRCSDVEGDKKLPSLSGSAINTSASPPPVVSSLSANVIRSETLKFSKADHNSKLHHHTSITSKLKLCTPSCNEQKRSQGILPYFAHSYGPFQHPHHSHPMNSIITAASSSGGIHNHNSHHHPLSHCPECLFLRRYCGGSNLNGGSSSGSSSRARTGIPSSASSSTNNVATNNMQFSSSMATPCGPTSSSLSASFTWMANPSIYDNSAIISPVAGYNPHVPLQPSFGLSASGFSTLANMQHCNVGGSSGRRKRSWSRAVFTNLQRKGLEKRFQLQKYITKPDRRQLAASLGLTDAQVKVWFQNRRMKWRHSKEGKVSSGTGEIGNIVTTSSSSPPVTSTTSSKGDGAIKDKKA